MKKKLVSIMLAFVLVFSFCTTAFAAVPEDNTVSPMHTHDVLYDISRTSATTADVTAVVHFSTVVEDYNVVVYLQKLVNGTWTLDTVNSERVIYNNGYGDSYFLFYNDYTSLERGASYRIKVVSKDYIDGNSYIASTFSPAF